MVTQRATIVYRIRFCGRVQKATASKQNSLNGSGRGNESSSEGLVASSTTRLILSLPVSGRFLREYQLRNSVDGESQGSRGHDEVGVAADLRLDLFVQFRRSNEPPQFLFGHF